MKSPVTVNVVDVLRAWYAQVVGRAEAQPEHHGSFNAVLSEALSAADSPGRHRRDGDDDDADKRPVAADGTEILLGGLFDTVHALGNSFNADTCRAEFNESALAALVSLLLDTLSCHHHRNHDKHHFNNHPDERTPHGKEITRHDHHEDPKNLQRPFATVAESSVVVSTASSNGNKVRSLGDGAATQSRASTHASVASGARDRIGSALITIVMPKDLDVADGETVDLRSTVPVAAATTAAKLVLLPSAAVDAADFDPLNGGDASLRCGGGGGFQQWSEDGTSAESQREKAVIMTPQAVLHGDDDSSIGTEAPGGHASGGDEGQVYEVNQYLMLKRLGRGAQGEVFLAVDSDTDAVRAIKVIPRPAAGTRVSAARRAKLEHLKREVGIMKRLRHRNVVSLHEVIDDPHTDKLYLVMDYIEHGSVATMTNDGAVSRTVDPVLLANYGRQLCAALQYLHRHGVIHRDIKPDNILIGLHDHVFVSDFGVSDAFDEGSLARAVSGTRGTPAFLAPELLQAGLEAAAAATTNGSDSDSDSDSGARSKPVAVDGEAVDTWALGITLYVLLYGKLPWAFTDAQDLFDAIQRRPIELRPQAAVARAPRPPPTPSGLSPSASRLMPGGRVYPVTPAAPFSPTSYRPCMDGPAVDDDDVDGVHGDSAAEARVGDGNGDPVSPRTPPAVPASPPAIQSLFDIAPPLVVGGDVANRHDSDSPRSINDNMESLRSSHGQLPGPFPPETSKEPGLLHFRMPPTCPQSHDGRPFMVSVGDVSFQFSTSAIAVGMMPSAAADEGWRRILHGMLQRDPKRRTPLGEVRKQLVTLEVHMEEAERFHGGGYRRSIDASHDTSGAFTARRVV